MSDLFNAGDYVEHRITEESGYVVDPTDDDLIAQDKEMILVEWSPECACGSANREWEYLVDLVHGVSDV